MTNSPRSDILNKTGDGPRSVLFLAAPCVVPMHYRHTPYGLPEVGGVEDFLTLWPEFRRLEGPSFLLDGSASGVIVPKFCGNTAV